VAEANSEASKICAQCGREFIPWKPKRGPRPSKCGECYPPERRAFLMRWHRGEHQALKTCAKCGSEFERRRFKRPLCSACLSAEQEQWRRRYNAAAWKAERGEKSPCAECGAPIGKPHYRRFCSDECGLAANRRMSTASRRARIVKADRESFDPLEILNRDAWTCYLCGKHTPPALRGQKVADAPELDHIIPLSKGGSHTRANVACACRACNIAKSDSMPLGRRRPCVPTARRFRSLLATRR
jgi:5-methylcytosine-specific restriction endonuclease McrA